MPRKKISSFHMNVQKQSVLSDSKRVLKKASNQTIKDLPVCSEVKWGKNLTSIAP
jgi:hypothetical protein